MSTHRTCGKAERTASTYSSAVSRTDRASLVIDAPLDRTFDAFVDRAALEIWLPPDGMTADFERFDPRPGGSYRLILTYDHAPGSGAKSSADTDIVEARYVEIVHDKRVVQEVDFVSDDPAFTGTMTMTWSVQPSDIGTCVEFIAEHVPDGISAEDHAAGMASSLENLAAYLKGSTSRWGIRQRSG
jgi:uncharacterized protein YndB with AHSA1/START domain